MVVSACMNKSSDSPGSPSVNRPPTGTGDDGLELPDGSDFDPPPRRLEPAAALRFCEEMSASFRRSDDDRAARRDRPASQFDLATTATGPENNLVDLLDELLPRH